MRPSRDRTCGASSSPRDRASRRCAPRLVVAGRASRTRGPASSTWRRHRRDVEVLAVLARRRASPTRRRTGAPACSKTVRSIAQRFVGPGLVAVAGQQAARAGVGAEGSSVAGGEHIGEVVAVVTVGGGEVDVPAVVEPDQLRGPDLSVTGPFASAPPDDVLGPERVQPVRHPDGDGRRCPRSGPEVPLAVSMTTRVRALGDRVDEEPTGRSPRPSRRPVARRVG